jgi:DNA-binding response OmpR family regulator
VLAWSWRGRLRDDKPFLAPANWARIKAMMRRNELLKRLPDTDEQGELQVDGIRIDPRKRSGAACDDQPLELTLRSLTALHAGGKPGRSYSRRELLRSVWGYQSDGYEHTVTGHVNRATHQDRTRPANPRYILTVWGIGYRSR